MSPAEFRCIREYLGLTTQWVATRLWVNPRAVLRWESEGEKVPENAAALMRDMLTESAIAVDDLIAAGNHLVVPNEMTWTHGDYPPTWHRAIAFRAWLGLNGITIEYEQ